MKLRALVIVAAYFCQAAGSSAVDQAQVPVTFSDTASDCSHVFQASSEWKVIQPDECIPPGLHIRIDFETGIKEAKLKDPHSDSAGSLVNDVSEQGVLVVNSPEIAKEGGGDMWPVLGKSASVEDIIRHLDFLEQEVGDTDEGITVMTNHLSKSWLVSLISPTFAQTNQGATAVPVPLAVRIHAARVFALAVANNHAAQSAALDTLKVLVGELAKGAGFADGSLEFQKSLMHAVTCLVRGNSRAVQLFWRDLNGFAVLMEVTEKLGPGRTESRVYQKVVEFCVDIFDGDLVASEGEGGSGVENQDAMLGSFRASGFCRDRTATEEIRSICALHGEQ
ncbi:hypothetical protein BJ741DRAFT_598421 [Chytriomyces cf. hyalinus JEL632]|nr:hypothetical protein BJ741DRAFT_598421 [Chytriomyces cf. hyalinus JEL632]